MQAVERRSGQGLRGKLLKRGVSHPAGTDGFTSNSELGVYSSQAQSHNFALGLPPYNTTDSYQDFISSCATFGLFVNPQVPGVLCLSDSRWLLSLQRQQFLISLGCVEKLTEGTLNVQNPKDKLFSTSLFSR